MSDLWMEHSVEKHECMRYEAEHVRSERIVIDGRDATLVVPFWLPEVEPLTTTTSGDLVFVVGRIRASSDGALDGHGALLIARRRGDGSYGVHVWHELYPHTLGHLGVLPSPPE